MESLFAPAELQRRMEIWCEKETRADRSSGIWIERSKLSWMVSPALSSRIRLVVLKPKAELT